MSRRFLLGSITLTLALSTVFTVMPELACAHDEGQHAGKALHGTIQTVAPNEITVEAPDGTLTIKLTEATAIEKDGKPAERSDLQAGEHVSISGTRLPGREVVAKEIRLEHSDPISPRAHDH